MTFRVVLQADPDLLTPSTPPVSRLSQGLLSDFRCAPYTIALKDFDARESLRRVRAPQPRHRS